MAQSIQKQVRVFTAIETKLHLRQICGEMLCADLVPCTDYAAFEQGESVLDRVSVNFAVHIFLPTVIDREVMVSEFVLCHSSGICFEVIGHDAVNIFADILSN